MSRMWPVVLLLALAFALPGSLFAQSKPGHVYRVSYFKVKPGQEAAYARAYAELVRPVFNELVKRKVLVSYLDLARSDGTGEYSHLFIVEIPNRASVEGVMAKVDEASRAVLGKPWDQATAEFTNLRELLRRELYESAVR